MKTIKKDVKSKTKTIGVVDVPVYENVAEAIKHLKEEKVLSLINRQYASDLTNEFRAAATREVSPMSQLARAAKTNPAVQAKIDALLKEYASAPAE